MKRKKCLPGDAMCRPHNKILDPAEVRAEWQRTMQRSNQEKMSRGAQEHAQSLASAHNDGWRKSDKQKRASKKK